jgi:hypothetical protein
MGRRRLEAPPGAQKVSPPSVWRVRRVFGESPMSHRSPSLGFACYSTGNSEESLTGFFAVFGVMGGTASPTARPHPRSLTGAPPETPRSTSDPVRGTTVRLPRVSGAARGRVGCRVGGTGGQRLDGLGCQAGFGGVAETREAGKGPEPGHRLARDPSGQPRNHSIGKSDEPGLALSGLGNK